MNVLFDRIFQCSVYICVCVRSLARSLARVCVCRKRNSVALVVPLTICAHTRMNCFNVITFIASLL